MPEEVTDYFDKRYSELKEKATTYGDLREIIKRTAKEERYACGEWGDLLSTQLMARLYKEWSSLPIIR